MKTKIENLVFKGGGVLGIAYTGAIEAFEEKKILTHVKRVAGTSAGAIVATLLSLRYSAEEIKTLINQTDFKSFEDGAVVLDAIHVINKYGFYKGDVFLNVMKSQIEGKGLNANATFQDFEDKGCRDLHIFASDLNIKGLKEFSVQKTPNVVVAEAVRASMSIPLFFRAWTFPNNNPDDHVYVDGGIIYNYPLTIFDVDGVQNPKTVGMFLADLEQRTPPSKLEIGNFFKYATSLVETILSAQAIDFEIDSTQKKRTIMIDNLGISATDFKLTEAQKQALFESGKKHAMEFLNGVG